MKLFQPLVFVIIYVVWILYRLLIKKDLKEHTTTLYFGIFFILIWVGIIYLMSLA